MPIERYDIDFGAWLRGARSDHGLDLKGLAFVSGIDIGTLSRIENDRVSPMLVTAIKICGGLAVSAKQLISELGIGKAPGGESLGFESDSTSVVLNPSEKAVDTFISRYESYPAETLDRICQAYENLSAFLNQTLPEYLIRAARSIPLLLVVQPSFLNIDLLRPPELTLEMILQTNRAGNFISIADAGFVLHKRRAKLGFLSLRKSTELKALMSVSMLSRIERGQIDRIKLVDAIALDEVFGESHDLFELYWRATQLQDKYAEMVMLPGCRSDRCEIKTYDLINIYVMLERWLQINGSPTQESIFD